MPPTIRIDDKVYAWLQQRAQPFEDTPNSVLRQIAGLDEPKAEQKSGENKGSISTVANRRLKGKNLNQQWQVGAKHALYHKDGTWFNNLERFPGALFDPNGYILFESEKEYRSCRFLNIGRETNVPDGIYRIPGYARKN